MTQEDLIQLFDDSQLLYCSSKDKKYLKDNSQFFTPISIVKKMIETIDFEALQNLDTIRILEPSAGCGILILELVFHIINNYTDIKNIELVAYETESELFDILVQNINLLKEYIMNNNNVQLIETINNSNFITSNSRPWMDKECMGYYNIIISNPPFNKINQNSEEAIAMKDLIYGQPNLYSLFIAMSLKLLADGGTYTVLSPRNYLTGEYSKKIREYIFNNYSLCHIHTFDDRKIFKFVNQEIVISTFKNVNNHENIKVSHNGKFELVTNINDLVYDDVKHSIIIPTDSNSLSVFKKFKQFQYTLKDLRVKVSVGPVVQFRNTEYLSEKLYSDNFAPLLISNDIQNNNINYISRQNNPKRKTHNKSINILSKNIIKNSNYLLIRKVTAKDDKDIIVAAVLLDSHLDHDFIGLDNNLLYIHKINRNEKLSVEECYGLFCYINSSYFEEYYSLINGTHTINVSDFSNIKFPCIKTIKSLGKELIKSKNFSKEHCTQLISNLFPTN